MDTRSKIISLDEAASLAARLRAEGRRLAVAAGGFDVLQAAHARRLASLASGGAAVLAAVYDDASLCTVTQQRRPVLSEHARARLVAGLAAVDYVLIWPFPDLDELVRRLAPDRLERLWPGERHIIGEVLARHKPNR